MINEISQQPIPYILSNAAQKAYDKLKALILKIFSLFKNKDNEKNLKERFHDSYMDFARKLDDEGHYVESNMYMSICEMYYDLMDRPKELISHETFFLDLFNAFDELLDVKINNSEKFSEKFDEFNKYHGRMRHYYYTKVAIPSEHYNEEVLNEISSYLAGDKDE